MSRLLCLEHRKFIKFDVPEGKFLHYLLDHYNEDNISVRVKEDGVWGSDYNSLCSKFIRPGSTVLDIGANLGSWGLEIARMHPNCEIHAFEPQKKKFYQLCANIYINDLDNVTAHRVAMTDSAAKELPFIINFDSNNGSSRLECEAIRSFGCALKSKVMVPSCTLDSMNLTNISFIKMDVEGHEISVLKGAVKTLKNNNYPMLAFESWDDPWAKDIQNELLDYVLSLGYVCVHIGDSEYVACHETKFESTMLQDMKLDDMDPVIVISV